MSKWVSCAAVFLLIVPGGGCAAARGEAIAKQLATVDPNVLGEGESLAKMIRIDLRERMRGQNDAETKVFEKLRTPAGWEAFRDRRLAALRRSLGPGLDYAPPPAEAVHRITGTVGGDGFKVHNLVIANRPHLPVTANLYVPDPLPAKRGPGILIITSHHNPKWQGECQDMGMTWARAGCSVLVTDNLGHGERRQQRYGGREDYRWRYYLNLHLFAVGETLMGWMVSDNRRALDVLCGLKQVDPKRVILIGAVAGGGDPAAVLAALDERVTCSIPFNFGARFAGKATADNPKPFANFIGGGDWECTRALAGSGPSGYTPWMLVASAAPRKTIFAKEFAWDRANDKGYARIERVFKLYGAPDGLTSMYGYGNVRQSSKVASHCNNVGAHHRKLIYPILAKWFGMKPPTEYRKRLKKSQLTCLPKSIRGDFNIRPVHELCADLAATQVATARAAKMPRDRLRAEWAGKLGGVEPSGPAKAVASARADTADVIVEKLRLRAGPHITVPALLLRPKAATGAAPVVVGVTEAEGKELFLKRRRDDVAGLLARGVAVCLIDVRGCGETRLDKNRGYWTSLTHRACEEQMAGGTMLGKRLQDLRAVLGYLRGRKDLDATRVAVWGESFAGVNPPDFVDPPLKGRRSAVEARPTGALLALLAGLYDEGIRAIVARGGLVGYASLLDGAACHVNLDVIVPGVLAGGDVADVAAALAPRPLRLEACVTGRNILADAERLRKDLAPVTASYARAPGKLSVTAAESTDLPAFVARSLAPGVTAAGSGQP